MKLSDDTVLKTFNRLYELALNGLPQSTSVFEVVEKLKEKKLSTKDQVKRIMVLESSKNFGSGFLSSFGGVFTLPITMPLEITASVYIQLRMNALIALVAGYDVRDEKIKTLIFCSLLGKGCFKILKDVGIDGDVKLSKSLLRSVSSSSILTLQGQLAMKLVTKFSGKKIMNMGRWVPVLAGVIGGGADAYFCYNTGKVAEKIFLGEQYV